MGESKRRPDQRLGDAPTEASYRAKMEALAEAIDGFFNSEAEGDDRKIGFVLMAFPFGGTGRCDLISNGADRRDIVILMKELIARFEGQAQVTGSA